MFEYLPWRHGSRVGLVVAKTNVQSLAKVAMEVMIKAYTTTGICEPVCNAFLLLFPAHDSVVRTQS
jgi:hypothetical protein